MSTTRPPGLLHQARLPGVLRAAAEHAELFLVDWLEMAVRCGPTPMADLSVAEHWDGVVRWYQGRVTNGVLEAISSLAQAARRRARGYRTTENLMAIVYLTVGNLDFGLPT